MARRCWPRGCRGPASTSTGRADDLDPALIAGASRRFLNARIAAGLGVIPRVVGEGRPIMQGKLPLAEAQRRIADYWHPYHDRLRALLRERAAGFGMAILFDCHSMPHDALNAAPPVLGPAARGGARRPLRRRLRALADRGGRRRLRRRRLRRRPQRARSPAATSPRPTAGRTRACTRCRSRSTARSTWTRRGSSGAPDFADGARPRSAGRRRRASRRSGPRPLPVAAGVGFPQKKRPCTRHGPSLGRKRP